MKEQTLFPSVEGRNNEPKKRVPLLRKFDIPVDHLDFRYVESCSDAREIERILRILRSGEEGHYPELVKAVEERLKELDPDSRVLRVEVPVLKSEYLDKAEREQIQNDLSEWIESFETARGPQKGSKIFEDLGAGDAEVPIRGPAISTVTTPAEDNFVKTPNPDRIKSWEYDKWDKLDVEAELTRLEVTDMQINEWEKFQKPKIQEEEKGVAKFMKNEERSSFSKVPDKPKISSSKLLIENPKVSKNKPLLTPKMSTDKPSFIEELPSDLDKGSGSKVTQNGESSKEVNKDIKPKRRIRIQIDDINIGY